MYPFPSSSDVPDRSEDADKKEKKCQLCLRLLFQNFTLFFLRDLVINTTTDYFLAIRPKQNSMFKLSHIGAWDIY